MELNPIKYILQYIKCYAQPCAPYVLAHVIIRCGQWDGHHKVLKEQHTLFPFFTLHFSARK